MTGPKPPTNLPLQRGEVILESSRLMLYHYTTRGVFAKWVVILFRGLKTTRQDGLQTQKIGTLFLRFHFVRLFESLFD